MALPAKTRDPEWGILVALNNLGGHFGRFCGLRAVGFRDLIRHILIRLHNDDIGLFLKLEVWDEAQSHPPS